MGDLTCTAGGPQTVLDGLTELYGPRRSFDCTDLPRWHGAPLSRAGEILRIAESFGKFGRHALDSVVNAFRERFGAAGDPVGYAALVERLSRVELSSFAAEGIQKEAAAIEKLSSPETLAGVIQARRMRAYRAAPEGAQLEALCRETRAALIWRAGLP